MVGRIPDLGLLASTSVTVIRQIENGTDPFGAPVTETEQEAVAGVLPQPGSTSDLDASRPEGKRVDMTFHFPRGYGKPLKGCSIQYGGETYRVVGDPQPCMSEITPGPFGLAVETERVDG